MGTRVDLAVADIAGEDWSAQEIVLVLHSGDPARFELEIGIGRLVLPDGHGELADVTLTCGLVRGDGGGWSCEDGRLEIARSTWAGQSARWTGRFAAADDWRLTLSGLRLQAGRANVTLVSTAGSTDARVTLAAMPLTRLVEALPPGVLPDEATLAGTLNGSVRATFSPAGLAALDADLVLADLAYAGPGGRRATEDLRLGQRLRVRRQRSGWRFETTADVTRGALYIEPVFVDASEYPLRLEASGVYRQAAAQVALDKGDLAIGDAVSISGSGEFTLAPMALHDSAFVARSDDVGRLYDVLIQPYLIGTPADSLTLTGRLGLAMEVDSVGIERISMNLDTVSLDDRAGRYGVDGMDASVTWARATAVPASRFDVDSALLYGLPIGSFRANFQFAPDRAWLVTPIQIPVLGGEVRLDRFRLDGALLAGDAPHWLASASVDGLDLEDLTTAFGWPPFGGTLTASLSDLQYADRRLDLGGEIVLRAFGGTVRVDPMTIEDPLGLVPVLEAGVSLRGLSLAALTETFSFGRITGEVDGVVEDLRLVAWQPDRFDLHLFTSPDSTRRRISQRAVENLTELGSGVPAGLSGTVLTLFDDFAYSAIDVRAALRGDTAELDGLPRSDGGYYLVRGAGLPRIDVIGRNRRVAWRELADRLRQIRLEGARIE